MASTTSAVDNAPPAPVGDSTPKIHGPRMPSLNQLAARINSTTPSPAPSSSSTSAAPRPRLAAFALRTGSTSSLSTAASAPDSTAVNISTTRSTSPMSVAAAPSPDTPTGDVPGGEPLTTETLARHDEETAATAEHKSKAPAGYKNIPSLDAITARLAKTRALSVDETRALSIDGSTKPPEPPTIEDPKTPGVQVKAPEHPLQFNWTLYHDTKAKLPPYTPGGPTPSSASGDSTFHPPESTDYEANLVTVGTFSTVEEFCRYFNWLKPPSMLERNSNYHLFKTPIKPMWEDPANAGGGKWVLTMKNNPQLLDRCWSWLAMALVGEELEEGGNEICGAVVSLRSKVDRIQVWTRSKDDVERLNSIGKKLVKLLDVSETDGIGLEFQFNTDDRPLPNKFLSIQALPGTGFRTSFHGAPNTPARTNPAQGFISPVSADAPAGAFGGFGVGTGIGGAAWRKRS